MDTQALFKIDYGLYILSANEGNKDNACIINTLMQVTSTPLRVEIAVNKLNYTCSMIQRIKKFNISILTNDTEFDILKRFGYESGRNINKFENFTDISRVDNNILYITRFTNAYLCAEVEQELDLDSHILFIAKVKEAQILSSKPTLTYEFYQNNIKPKPQIEKGQTNCYRCKICNYIYKGDFLPKDFICPICKHGFEDFEKI